jgi:hypothetical protein
MRWAEEVDLLEEEMRRIIEFLRWRAGWWKERVDMRGLPEGPQREGETAYAMRQANIQATLASEFLADWAGLAQLIEDARAGEVVAVGEAEVANGGDSASDAEDGEEAGEASEAGDGEDEEDEESPISKLPQRAVKSAYMDEVLAM